MATATFSLDNPGRAAASRSKRSGRLRSRNASLRQGKLEQARTPSGALGSGEQADDQHDDAEYQQQMDGAEGDLHSQPQHQPGNDEEHRKDPQNSHESPRG